MRAEIEELILYLIGQQKEVEELRKRIEIISNN